MKTITIKAHTQMKRFWIYKHKTLYGLIPEAPSWVEANDAATSMFRRETVHVEEAQS